MTFEESLNARHACKKFSDKAISSKDLDFILEAGRLAPSGYGFEPWKFIVVGNEYRTQLAKCCYNQENVATASYNIVILGRMDLKSKDEFARVQVRRFATDDAHFEQILGVYTGWADKLSDEEIFHFSQTQCYLPLMQMMNAAIFRGIDSCAIGGFERKKVEEFLDIKKPFGVAVVLSLGYRANEPHHDKKRQDKSQVIEFWEK